MMHDSHNINGKARQQEKIYLIILLAIMGLAALLRFYQLDRLGLWADELWVVMDSTQGSLWQMLQTVYYDDNHPPGYYILMRVSQWLLGSSDFAIRLHSVLAGIVLVFFTYIVGRKHYTMQAALIAAALVATSYQMVYFSQEARANMLLALFCLLSFHYFRAICHEGDTSQKNYLVFWVAAVGSCYLHYSGLIFIACLGLIGCGYLLSRWIKTHNTDYIKVLIKAFLPVLLLYAPWLPGTWQHLVNSPPEAWQHPVNLATLEKTRWYLFGPERFTMVLYTLSLAGAVALVIVNMLKHREPEKTGLILLTLLAFVLPIALFFIKSSLSQSAYNHRHFLYAIPLASLLVGYMIVYVLQRWMRFKPGLSNAVILLIVLLITVGQTGVLFKKNYYRAQHFKAEYREAADLVARQNVPVISSTRFFDHYLQRFGNIQSLLFFTSPKKIEELNLQVIQHKLETFYFLEAPAVPKRNDMVTKRLRLLAEHYTPQCRTKFKRVQVIKFSVRTSSNIADFASLPACES